jgi:probable rRNA maturation factor
MTALPVQFFYQDVSFSFPKRTLLKKFISKIFAAEQQPLQQINIIFCTDEALLAMNRDFLQHDYYTDIITFPLSAKGEPVNAELYISVDRVKDNARKGNVSFQTELQRVIFHGCLHLTGYNDKSSQQIKRMREREDHYLHLYSKQLK